MEKKKSYIGQKLFILLLSFIILVNGLGLYHAGKKVNKTSWKVIGIAYIIVEWIFAITGLVPISTIIICVAIIHTASICHEYGEMLWELERYELNINRIQSKGNKKYPKQQSVKPQIVRNTQPIQESGDTDNNSNSSVNDGIHYDVNIGSAGSALVTGSDEKNLSIKIIDDKGAVYEFKSKGNKIVSVKHGAQSEKSYV